MNNYLKAVLDSSIEYTEILDNIDSGKKSVLATGLIENQRSEMSSFLLRKGIRHAVITHSDAEAQKLHNAFIKKRINSVYIQSEDIRFYSVEAKDRKLEAELVESLYKLSNNDYDLAVFSSDSLIKKYVPKEYILSNSQDIAFGQVLDKNQLIEKLINTGYVREHKVEGIGQFSMRGGIVDIFTPGIENPVRIELFDDEVDSIRIFDIFTQKSIEKVNKVKILPARSFIYPQNLLQAIKEIEDDISDVTNQDISFDLERIKNRIYFEGVSKYINYFYDRENTIFDYVKDISLFEVNDPNRVVQKLENVHQEFSDNFEGALEKGFAIKREGELLLAPSYVVEKIKEKKNIFNTAVTSSIKDFPVDAIVDFETREAKVFNGKIFDFINELKYLRSNDYVILISLKDEEFTKNLQKALKENNVGSVRINIGTQESEHSNVIFTDEYFAGGSIYSKHKLAIFTKNEIFNTSKSTDRKFKDKVKTSKIESFIELKPGDFVVHENYGIGKFVAVEQKEFDSITKDYIKIIYGGGDTLYLPLEQMSKIQRYIGNSAEDGIKLSKLSSNEWKKTRSRAKKIIELIAKDLVELYAKRENTKGYRYSQDTVWQKEFEYDFPYVETNDQLRAIEDVKNDMESEKVMDRLICGDVGYGKTEVAIRAIFKACMESKQCAFLVPTTILSQQHYNTIKERFENFPIKVEVLSRFRTTKDQEKIIEKISSGEVDVVIGTHRLLSKDIKFKDLGLIVVDEEQRFGVKDKEKLKKLRTNSDVISLSATPIPRTLHMSLSGIRDMSLLEEPPRERQAIITYVMEARESIIADAIEREIHRGGQIYFVYNRVQTIEKMYQMLQRIVPSARIAVAHGQMSPRKLEKIVNGFTNKEYDVLISTTIIETGMDISNANTMIVYDADKMGLSQLYQLRGRVGRSSRQGYAYFMYEKDKVLTEVSEKRLKTIKEFTEFGSGFKVAMRDLEIRGAGTLLGETQHGHIADIGYEMYVKMLEQEIMRLKGETVEEDVPETEVAIKLNAYIPNDYIENEMDKIEVYKKISSISNQEDKMDIEIEIEDRFSDMPFSVSALIEVAYIRSLGKKLKIAKIVKDKNTISFISREGKIIVKKDFGKLQDYKLVKSIAQYLEKMV
ncbi:transcription-repair coupling factor [Proteocatella sphenisci]|uniref:transcription-repair coupling factor n=1 Tax=Proteocatella sphenisci TaxID=181070 RepID=UPI00048CB9F5|nr:transcription-repair coupling factor [Proteocatella sphenisci]